MAYNSGKRPFEAASKSNHTHVINDSEVQKFLEDHELPKESDSIELFNQYLVDIDYLLPDNVEYIIAIDGGNTTVPVKTKFPSATVTFFQFGASYLEIADLKNLKKSPFISPDDMTKLRNLQRIKLVIPTKNVGLKLNNGTRATLTYSVRKALFDFFLKNDYLSTLKWFLYEEYNTQVQNEYVLASHPNNPDSGKISIPYSSIKPDFTITHPDGDLFLTDVFRLHEIIDDELGAGGILGYLTNLIEHFILINIIRGIYKKQKNALNNVLFIKDGPLGFFGQTANMHKPMRNLINYLFQNSNIYLVGIEKSGSFVEHALEISNKLKPGQAYMLSNKHIYKFIQPGDADTQEAYGRSSYYGSKLVFKSQDEKIYVVTLPTENADVVLNPQKNNFKNIDIILKYIEELKSDMYDNALLPIALANKLVSLSDHPSSVLLEKFAKSKIH